MRFLGVDFGRKRIGLALSDSTGLVATPWLTVEAGQSPAQSASTIADAISSAERDRLGDADPVAGIVVGLPRRLDGSDTDETAQARALADALGARTGVVVHLQDERLTSHEAERRLAEREPDWRRRKARIDAAAAAIILQDFLDERARASRVEPTGAC